MYERVLHDRVTAWPGEMKIKIIFRMPFHNKLKS